MKIAVVEDCADLRAELVDSLKANDFILYEAESLVAMEELLFEVDIDIVLLDLTLSDGNSLTKLYSIREKYEHTLGIIIISAHGQQHTRAVAIAEGADAYLVKPIYFPELLSHIKRISARLQPKDHWQLKPALNLLVAPNQHRIVLTSTECALLTALCHNATPVARDCLLSKISPLSTSVNDYRRLDTLICRLRTKITAHCGQTLPLKTVRNQGYQLYKTKITNH